MFCFETKLASHIGTVSASTSLPYGFRLCRVVFSSCICCCTLLQRGTDKSVCCYINSALTEASGGPENFLENKFFKEMNVSFSEVLQAVIGM